MSCVDFLIVVAVLMYTIVLVIGCAFGTRLEMMCVA